MEDTIETPIENTETPFGIWYKAWLKECRPYRGENKEWFRSLNCK